MISLNDLKITNEQVESPHPEEKITPHVAATWEELQKQVDQSPPVIFSQDEGDIDEQSMTPPPMIKSAYYVVFGPKDHKSTEVGKAIQSVHIARFESKAQLKKVVESLDSNGFKLIDILKGKPLPFKIQTRKISEIKIG